MNDRHCAARDAATLFKLHRETYESFFLQPDEKEPIYQKRRASISTLLLTTLNYSKDDIQVPDPFSLLNLLHDSFYAVVDWKQKQHFFLHNALSVNDIYDLAFERYIFESLHTKIALGDDKICPLRWLCMRDTCPHACQTNLVQARNEVCRTLMVYPENITKEAQQFSNGNISNIFESHEYEQYFNKLSQEGCLHKILSTFEYDDITDVSRKLLGLHAGAVFSAAKACVSEFQSLLDKEISDKEYPTSKDKESAEKHKAILAPTVISYRSISSQLSLMLRTPEFKNRQYNRLQTLWRLLIFIIG
ncbi:MAG: hypothetical protein IJK63_04195 [Oscillospiraceae bacterium]|nr:hypothetical protein [Oscillospiraceae bacterium]